MTKTAIVTRYFLPVQGGIEIHCLNLAKRLKNKGLEVELHTSEDTYLTKGALKRCEIVNDLRVYRHRHFYYTVSKYLKYDVVHLHNFNVLPHGLILLLVSIRRTLRMSTPRIIITTHGGFNPYWNDFPVPLRIMKKIYKKTLARYFLNHIVDKIIAVSQWEYTALVHSGIKAEKIELIPNGVEDDAYSFPSLSDEKLNSIKPYLCFIGRIAKIKNLEFLIRAVQDLKVSLVIAGQVTEPDYYQYIMKLINETDAKNRIFYYHEVYGRNKYALIDNALQSCLHPSTNQKE